MRLTTPRCIECGEKATIEVFNRFNSSCGKFCNRHGAKKVARLDEVERIEIAPAPKESP
jgi:hypothetical protein